MQVIKHAPALDLAPLASGIVVAVIAVSIVLLAMLVPSNRAAMDTKMRQTEEALCVKFGFAKGSRENLSCMVDIQGVRNETLTLNPDLL
jgi:hypothetical protein